MRKRKSLKLALVILRFVSLVAWTLAFEVACFGHVNDPGPVAAGVIAGSSSIWIPRWQDRNFRKLDARSRMAVKQTMRTGVPNGDPVLDSIALTRLERAWQSSRGSHLLVPAFGLAFVVIPVIAAIRAGTLWLLCLVCLLLLLPMRRNVKSQRDAGHRLAMLRQLML